MRSKADNAKQTRNAAHKRQTLQPVSQESVLQQQQAVPLTMSVRHAIIDPGRTQPAEVLALQRAAGNRAVSALIQAKLIVGPVGDCYGQEADCVAAQVVSMPAPRRPEPVEGVSGQRSAVGGQSSVQRQEEEEELQPKLQAASVTPLIQRPVEEEEEELQIKPLVQRQGPEEEEEILTKPPVQRQAEEEEEEVQTKPLLLRQGPEEEEEIQTKRLAASITPLVQRQAPEEEEEDVQTKPLAASVTPRRGLDVVQMVPLYAGSEIDYDAAAGTMGFGELVPRNIAGPDLITLRTAIANMQLHHVDQQSIEKQLKEFWKPPHNRIETDLMVKMWRQKANHLATLDARRAANRNQLILGGLLDNGDIFDAYELTSADPHKGGAATLFERYQTADGQIKRLVYKPADLSPEAMIYQGGTFRVAQFGGTYAAPAAGVAGVHGYMTFLKEEGPRNAEDVADIYHSLGEAAAVAYVYGLRDLHKENYIMLRNRIQWIDLEAMTGTFQTYIGAEMARPFFEGLMQKMLHPLIQATEPGPHQWFKNWTRKINRWPLIRALRALNTDNQILAGFNAKRAQITLAKSAQAAGLMTRFVPFPTEQLYDLVIAWHNKAELDAGIFPPPAWDGHPPAWYTDQLNPIKALYRGPPAEVDAMLQAPRTRAAIRRGDIPFFLRSGNSICDESGQVIVAHSGHERLQLGAGAATLQADIEARRTGPVPDALNWLKNEAGRQHLFMITALEQPPLA
jgi:hypothetical protein